MKLVMAEEFWSVSTRNFEVTVMGGPDNHPCLVIIVFGGVYCLVWERLIRSHWSGKGLPRI